MKRRASIRLHVSGVVLMALAEGCATPEVRPELLVIVDTDAPVPRFGDRLRIDVADDRGVVCSGCSIVVDASRPDVWPLSFGLVPAGFGAVRARLYRARDELPGGEPRPSSSIDALARVPDGVTGVVTTRLTLLTDCAGAPASPEKGESCIGADQPSAPAPELAKDTLGPHESMVGTWPGAAEAPCGGAAARDEICVPGGAFYMGDDVVDPSTAPAHLVAMRPFFLDVDEVTVGVFRPWLQKVVNTVPFYDVHPQTGPVGDYFRGCTVPQLLSLKDNDALPLNCVSLALADRYCKEIKKRLPTEAEWEWAAHGRDEERPFPWGDDPLPSCSEVVYARGYFAFDVVPSFAATCTFPTDDEAPPPAAIGHRDVSRDGARDLGGGLREWTSDDFHAYADACWSARPLPVSPRCEGAVSADPCATAGLPPGRLVTVRGGSWETGALAMRAVARVAQSSTCYSPDLGFRCARDDDGSAPPDRPPPAAAPEEVVCGGPKAVLSHLRDARVGASSIYANGYDPRFVLDGDTASSWFAEGGAKEAWIEIELPFAAAIAEVTVRGNTGAFIAGSDFSTARIELYDDAAKLIRADAIELSQPAADGTLAYATKVPAVRRIRFAGDSWQNQGSPGSDNSPGISELVVLGECPAGAP